MIDRPAAVARAPAAPLSSHDEALLRELSGSVLWAFQGLFAACAFCAITVLSRGDWELLAGSSKVDVPLAGLQVVFLAFFIVGPLILLSMQLYLHVQSHALLRLTTATSAGATGLVQQHRHRWPTSLLGLASYVLVPGTIALFVWKIWPRRYAGDSAWLNEWQWVAVVVFVMSLVASLRAAIVDSECLSRPGRAWRRPGALLLILTWVAVVAGLVAAVSARQLDLRTAPLEKTDLRKFDLRGADLREARLAGAWLAGAELQGARLGGAFLDKADLRGAKLQGAVLSRARLNGADLRGACLAGAQVNEAEIEGADFRYAWMVGAWFQPRRRTLEDRLRPLSPADAAYEAADRLISAQFGDAKLCGVHIDPTAWGPDADVGVPSDFGRYYAADTWGGAGLPRGLVPTAYPPAVADGSGEARDRFRRDVARTCVAELATRPAWVAEGWAGQFAGACPGVAEDLDRWLNGP